MLAHPLLFGFVAALIGALVSHWFSAHLLYRFGFKHGAKSCEPLILEWYDYGIKLGRHTLCDSMAASQHPAVGEIGKAFLYWNQKPEAPRSSTIKASP